MDVTCNRCGAEYEFEETLISDRGTTVKCTNCGHLFKVFHPRIPYDKSLETKPWLIRNTNGLVEPLQSLGELARLITQGHFVEDDEISRTSQVWKRLGDIEELRSFFEISRRRSDRPKAQSESPIPGVEKNGGAPSPRLPNGIRSSESPTRPDIFSEAVSVKTEAKAAPPQARRRADTITMWSSTPPAITSVDQDSAAVEEKQPSEESRARQRKPAPLVGPLKAEQVEPRVTKQSDLTLTDKRDSDNRPIRVQTARVSDGSDKNGNEKRQPAPLSASTPSERDISADSMVEKREPSPVQFDVPEPPERLGRGRVKIVLGIVIAVVIAGGIWLGWYSLVDRQPRSAPVKSEKPTSRKYWTDQANAVLARDRVEGYAAFVDRYTKSLASDPNNKDEQISISRVNAVWAQALRFKLFEQFYFRKVIKEKQSVNADVVESQIMLNSDRAKLHAEEALRIDRSDPEAQIALSDALRLTGDLEAARRTLHQVRFILAGPSVEFLRVFALELIDEADGDFSSGLELAKQAVARDAKVVRTRLLLAYCALASNDVNLARLQVKAILQQDRDHPEARVLENLIKVNKKKVQKSSEEAVEEIKPKDDLSKDQKRLDAVAPSEKPLEPEKTRLISTYIELGDKALENGNIASAKKMFESALAINPDEPLAINGLGYIDLERGRINIAIIRFRKALKNGYVEANIGLGEAFRRAGRLKEALLAYERYAQIRPNGGAISIARRQIEQLREQLSNATTKDKTSRD
ncbi:MAG: zinc-ribbon domain-containing protein [Deltaproteobacteria bacterium]|nr:zinc-ribbon domain-containing protein [Deltaproteobacteria bacterium]